MMKNIFSGILLLMLPIFCFSQNIDDKNALFATGGYRINGGEYEFSAGYERFLENSSNYSLYSSLNYQQIETTIVGNMSTVSNTLLEIGGKRYFLKHRQTKISPFVGAGFILGNSHIKGDESQESYPITQNTFNYGGTFSLGSEFFLSNSFSLSITGKYMYDSKHHIFTSLGTKFYF